MDTIFSLSSTFVLPFWLLMIVAPHWRGTRRIMRSPLPVAVLAAVYAILVVPRLAELMPLLAQPRLEPIAALLSTPAGATIAWIHFLAFDLFVGRWAYLDSRDRGISAWLMAPVLLLTLLVGPLGFLAYLALRLGSQRAGPVSSPPHAEASPAAHAEASPAAHAEASPAAGAAARARTAAILDHLEPAPILQRLGRVNAPLTIVGVLMLATLLGTFIGLLVDQQVITGAPAFLKPAKFAISTSIYAFTFVWLLSFVRGHQRLVSVIANATAAGLTIEVAIIILQVIRGTTSHFNFSTPLDAALFVTMAAIIGGVWLMAAAAAVLLLVQRLPDAAFAWSLRISLLIALVGMAVAFFMTGPTPAQTSAMSAGAAAPVVGAHSVGVPDGGPGLPIVGWSTLGGDLRVAHFVGLHALQVLPLIGWWLSRRRDLSDRHQLGLVVTAGLTYLGLVVLLTWQALRGQSVIAPDSLTLSALVTLVGLALVAAGAILIRERLATPHAKGGRQFAGDGSSLMSQPQPECC